MKNIPSTYSKSSTTKWLSIVMLLLSIFASAGYSRTAPGNQQKTLSTELVISSHRRTGKRVIPYQKTCKRSSFNHLIKDTRKYWAIILFTCTHQTRVKFSSILVEGYSRNFALYFLAVKIIPQSTDAYFLNLL